MSEDRATLSDEKLISGALAGDSWAFEALVERYFGMVHAIAYSRLGQREAAEDLAQEVFLRSHLYLDKVRQPERFAGWLVRVTHNLLTDWERKEQRKSKLVRMVQMEGNHMDLPDNNGKNAGEMIEEKEQNRAIQEAVFSLPLEQREIVMLHFTEGLSKSDIAARLDIHPSTVGRHLDKALKSLRRPLEKVLFDSVRELRPTGKSLRNCVAVLTASAAMSAGTKASVLAAAGGTAWLSTIPVQSSAAAGWAAAIFSGGMFMAKAKGIVAVIIILIGIGGAYIVLNNDQGGIPENTAGELAYNPADDPHSEITTNIIADYKTAVELLLADKQDEFRKYLMRQDRLEVFYEPMRQMLELLPENRDNIVLVGYTNPGAPERTRDVYLFLGPVNVRRGEKISYIDGPHSMNFTIQPDKDYFLLVRLTNEGRRPAVDGVEKMTYRLQSGIFSYELGKPMEQFPVIKRNMENPNMDFYVYSFSEFGDRIEEFLKQN